MRIHQTYRLSRSAPWIGPLLLGIACLAAATTHTGSEPAIHAVNLWESLVYMPRWAPGSPTTLLDVGDVDSDGFLDLVCFHEDRVIVLVGDGRGGIRREDWTPLETEPVPGTSDVLVTAPVGSFAARSGRLLDLDADGDLDLLVSVTRHEPPAGDGHFVYGLANRCGGFERHFCQETSRAADRLWPLLDAANLPVALLAASYEPGSAWTTLCTYPLVHGEPGGPSDPVRVEGSARAMVADDVTTPLILLIDSDGAIRLVTITPSGAALPWAIYRPPNGRARDVVTADLDDDGRAELVVATSEGIAVARLGEGGPETAFACPLSPAPLRLAVGSLDSDGHLDLLVTSAQGDELLVVPGVGDGGLATPSSRFAARGATEAIRLEDLDGDGRSDLVLSSVSGLRAWRNGGDPCGATVLPLAGGLLLACGDVDRDGDVDLVTDAPGGVDVLWNNGSGAMVPRALHRFEVEAIVAAAVGNGIVWAMVSNASGGGIALHAILANGGRGVSATLPSNASPVVRVGDLDRDGRADPFGVTPDSLWVVWAGERLAEFPLDGELSLPVCGDFDGDGALDAALVATGEWAEIRRIAFDDERRPNADCVGRLGTLPLSLAPADLHPGGGDELVVAAVRIVAFEDENGVTLRPAGWEVAICRPSDDRCAELTAAASVESNGLPWPVDGPAVGDLDGNGSAEIAIGSLEGTGVARLTLDDDGTPAKLRWIDRGLGPLFAVDLDGNGRDELVGSSLGASPRIVILWNGAER